MATHCSTLAWKIPWTEEPGRLLSMGSHRVGHDWATSLSLYTFHALEKDMATHSSVLAWRIPGKAEPGGLPSMGVAQSRTRLKRLSSSSSMVLTIVSRSSWGLRWEKKKKTKPSKETCQTFWDQSRYRHFAVCCFITYFLIWYILISFNS